MNIKDISKIISDGSTKKRAWLMANHVANISTNKEGLLNQDEIQSLLDSFDTHKKIEVYNHYKQMDSIIKNSLSYLNQLRLIYINSKTKTDSLIAQLFICKRIENTINLGLTYIDDKNLRNKLLNFYAKQTYIPYLKVIKEKESIRIVNDYPSEKDKKPLSIISLLIAQKKEATRILILAKTFLKAIKDFIDEKDFKIKSYIDMIKEVENDLKTIAPTLGEQSLDKDIINKMKDNNYFYPDFDSIEIDENQYKEMKDMYL